MRLIAIAVGLLAALSLTGCAHKQAATASAPMCIGPIGISQFLERFAEDPQIQRRATLNPLPYSWIDNTGRGEPVVRRDERPVSAFSAPIYPSKTTLEQEGRRISMTSTGAGLWDVTITKPDTDWVVVYHFSREPCWRLVAMADHSL